MIAHVIYATARYSRGKFYLLQWRVYSLQNSHALLSIMNSSNSRLIILQNKLISGEPWPP